MSTSQAPSGKSPRASAAQCESQAGLARAARSGKREQARPCQQAPDFGNFLLTADETGDLGGQIVRRLGSGRPSVGMAARAALTSRAEAKRSSGSLASSLRTMASSAGGRSGRSRAEISAARSGVVAITATGLSPVKGRSPGEGLVEHYPEGIQVGAGIHRLAARLLRRQVEHGAGQKRLRIVAGDVAAPGQNP